MKCIMWSLMVAMTIAQTFLVRVDALGSEGDRDISVLLAKAVERHPGLPDESRALIRASYMKYVDLMRKSAMFLEVAEETDWAVKLVRFGKGSSFRRGGNTLASALHERKVLVDLTDEATVAAIDKNLPFRRPKTLRELHGDIIKSRLVEPGK